MSATNVINKGRKAVAKRFAAEFNIAVDFDAEEDRSEYREESRSYSSQAYRSDRDLMKHERLDIKDPASARVTQRKIETDHGFRLMLARRIANAASSPYPARFLLSTYHQYAYRVAVHNGEILQENLGKRLQRYLLDQGETTE